MLFTSILSAAVALASVAVAVPVQDRRSFNMRGGVNYTGKISYDDDCLVKSSLTLSSV